MNCQNVSLIAVLRIFPALSALAYVPGWEPLGVKPGHEGNQPPHCRGHYVFALTQHFPGLSDVG